MALFLDYKRRLLSLRKCFLHIPMEPIWDICTMFPLFTVDEAFFDKLF